MDGGADAMSLPVAAPSGLPEPAPLAYVGPGPGTTRMQRLAILVALLVGSWVALQLFASVLLHFVASAATAYFVDPTASRLTRLGMPRGPAFGFLGVLLAVPMAAVIGVLCRFWLRRYLRSPLYLEPPSRQEREP